MKIVWIENTPHDKYGPGRIYELLKEKFWGEFFKNRKLWFFKRVVKPISLNLFSFYFLISQIVLNKNMRVDNFFFI